MRKTILALFMFALFAGVWHFIPAFRRREPVRAPAAAPAPPVAADPETGFLTDRSGALIPFYAALEKVETKQRGSLVRILHFGDSPVTADQITADVRSLLQERFGDAGHGFVLAAKPWAW